MPTLIENDNWGQLKKLEKNRTLNLSKHLEKHDLSCSTCRLRRTRSSNASNQQEGNTTTGFGGDNNSKATTRWKPTEAPPVNRITYAQSKALIGPQWNAVSCYESERLSFSWQLR
ncbi:hypothetical protein [Noviherbaspirillum galbum]|uniref:Uncharacterized protein n=1 Tax=Noviherbaspirillum galbum TaxID=2709383 RepID=A0A6B3SLE4_9BURK|nr:hypothetical protein [Noviherbaspirillum galbum]NEX60195.1 hypothetical protein [Noviherbaspirillum galbum]